MDILAPRIGRFKPSASTEASALANELRAAGRDIVDFSIGEPDFATPDNIKAAAIAAMDNDETHYTNTNGTLDLRVAICGKLLRENGLDFTPDEIVASSGAKHSMLNIFLATVSQGNEVIVPSPYWISYPNQVKLAGGTPVIIDCTAKTGFKLTPDLLRQVITPASRWLVINSPNNPSGAIYSRAELRALADVLAKHPDIWVLTDEIYEHFVFDGAEHVSILQAAPELRPRTVIVNGVSKGYAMTGWRIGYLAAPAVLAKAITKLQSQCTSCPPSISQAAAIEALTGPQDSVRDFREILQTRREVIANLLGKATGLKVNLPDGAMYLFVDCSACIGLKTPGGVVLESDIEFSKYLLEHVGVNVVPGAAYGMSGQFRLSFATSIKILNDGGSRIQKACADLMAIS